MGGREGGKECVRKREREREKERGGEEKQLKNSDNKVRSEVNINSVMSRVMPYSLIFF